jgi:hypothetical protein
MMAPMGQQNDPLKGGFTRVVNGVVRVFPHNSLL